MLGLREVSPVHPQMPSLIASWLIPQVTGLDARPGSIPALRREYPYPRSLATQCGARRRASTTLPTVSTTCRGHSRHSGSHNGPVHAATVPCVMGLRGARRGQRLLIAVTMTPARVGIPIGQRFCTSLLGLLGDAVILSRPDPLESRRSPTPPNATRRPPERKH